MIGFLIGVITTNALYYWILKQSDRNARLWHKQAMKYQRLWLKELEEPQTLNKQVTPEDGWFCDWCSKKVTRTESGYVHTDGIAYCSKECAEARDANR